MAKTGDYKIENIYQGGYSSFKPGYMSNEQYPIKTGSLGMTTDPRVANILQEVSSKLSSGTKHMEIEGVMAETLDSIPKQQFEEVRRLAKLTGISVSMHGPVIDSTGIGQNGFSELSREESERKIIQTLERSHELNPDGNIPVNFHSAEGIPGSQFASKRNEKGEREYKRMIAVDRESGKLIPLETERKFYPGGEVEEKTRTPNQMINDVNATNWDNSLSQIEFNRIRAEEILRDVDPITREKYVWLMVDKQNPGLIPKDRLEEVYNISPKEYDQIKKIHAAATYTDQAMRSLTSAFNNAYKYAEDSNQKKFLNELSNRYGEALGLKEKGEAQFKSHDPKVQSDAIYTLIQGLERVRPEMYVPIEQFAVEQSAKTYGNAAFEAYKKFKDPSKTPMVVIENPPAGFALSTGEDVKNLVEASREQFIKKAVEENKLSEGDAKKIAEKLIGATLDVGHMNMLRKYGYSEKDIIEEAKRISPVIKHVHLSDNFGFEHTELPMGMGNVPMKEMMEKLGQKGFDAKKIIEAGQWWQHFKTSPFQASVEGLGAAMYTTRVAPYWNQAPGLQQDYAGGYGSMLPQTNYETFGSGFSQLPAELGGQKPGGGGSRMSGRQME
jgi:hypothetical protein